MVTVDAARELLHGITALRLGLIDREGLTAALIAWKSTRGVALSKVLVSRGLLRADRLATLEADVDALVRTHGGSAERALKETGPLALEFGRLLEADPFQTLTDVPTELDTAARANGSPDLPGTVADLNPGTLPTDPGMSPDESSIKMPSNPNLDAFATIADEPGTGSGGDLPPKTVAYDGPASTLDNASSGPGSGSAGPGSYAGIATPTDLYNLRYQVLRMHAKGGLGQVFVARDAELNREVALKEIQGKYADKEESRLRFLIEAEVTGGLEHPGIVPVYGLGRYPDGRPYYAMRFIRGESMKEAIDRFHEATDRDPSDTLMELRKLLGQLVDVCNAMAYAHSRGVLHRDLKPGNIMLGAFGETLVVDWGLAKFKDSPEGETTGPNAPIRPMSAGSTSRTLFGSAVGTPQYMSPEQAAGQLDKLGPASDIYSLGVILYTILTGTMAFPDRSLTTILDKVRKGDFSPPREVNRQTHPALNAICMKAMALRPEDRYPSARALADDLEHWMADEPVSVYREPFLTRLTRWAKRHKTAVASVAALLVTAVVSLGIYSVLIKQEQARTARFYGLARFAVDRMLTELGQEDLADIPQMELVRRKMLTEAQTFYTRLLKERGNDPSARDDVARAGIRLGDIETLLGEDKQAEDHYGGAIAVLQTLHTGKPDDRSYRDDLARAYHSRGLLFRKLNRLKEADVDFQEALRLRTDLTREAPATTSYQRDRVDTLYHLAALHAKLAPDAQARAKVVDEYNDVIKAQQALADGPDGTLDDRRLLGRYMNNLAILMNQDQAGRAQALDVFRKAETIQAEVVAKQPKVAITRYELAKTNGNLHMLLASQKKNPEAEERGRRDLEIVRQLAQEFRNITEFREGQAAAALNLGKYLLDDQPKLAGKELDEAVTIGTDLVKTHGDRRECRRVLGIAQLNRGVLREKLGKREEAEADLRAAAETLRPLADAQPAVVEDVINLGNAYYQLALLLSKRDPKSLASPELAEAIKYHERAKADVPLWNDLKRKFALLERRTDPDALKDLHEAVATAKSLVKAHEDRRECHAVYATALLSRGMILSKAGQLDKAEADFVEAAATLAPFADAKPPVADDLIRLGDAYYQRAKLRRQRDSKNTSSAELDQAIAYHKRAAADSPLWRDYKLKFDWLKRRTDPAAILEADEAVAIGSSLVKDHEDRRECLAVRASALTSRGVILEATRGLGDGGQLGASALTSLRMIHEAIDQPAKAEEDFLKARDLLKPLVEGAGSNPNPDDINDLGLVHYNLASIRSRLGYPDEAMADLEEAIALHERGGANPSTDDTAIPQLWFDLDLKAKLLAKRKPRDYPGEANTAERLPALRPGDPYSAIRAARALAACTFGGVYGGKPNDLAIQAPIEDYANRTLKVLQTAAERGLIGVKELDQPIYEKVSGRAEFGKVRELLRKKGS